MKRPQWPKSAPVAALLDPSSLGVPQGLISRHVLDKLEGTQNRLRREVAQLEREANRSAMSQLSERAQLIASCFETHSALLDAVLEALSEDPIDLTSRSKPTVR